MIEHPQGPQWGDFLASHPELQGTGQGVEEQMYRDKTHQRLHALDANIRRGRARISNKSLRNPKEHGEHARLSQSLEHDQREFDDTHQLHHGRQAGTRCLECGERWTQFNP